MCDEFYFWRFSVNNLSYFLEHRMLLCNRHWWLCTLVVMILFTLTLLVSVLTFPSKNILKTWGRSLTILRYNNLRRQKSFLCNIWCCNVWHVYMKIFVRASQNIFALSFSHLLPSMKSNSAKSSGTNIYSSCYCL